MRGVIPGPWAPMTRSGLSVLVILDVLRQFPEELLPIVSLFGGLFGDVLGWAVIAAVLYQSTALFVPDSLSSWEFRSTFTLFALAEALVVSSMGTTGSFRLLGAFGLVTAFAAVGLLGYVYFVAGWNFFDPEGTAVSLVNGFASWANMRDELCKIRGFEGWLRVVAFGIWITGIGVVLAVPCAITGFAAALLAAAFPLPDLLLLGFVGVEVGLFPVSDDSFQALDVEERAYATLQSATRNLKGAILTTFSIVGGLAGAVLLSITLSLLTGLWSVVRLATPASPLLAWDFFGLALLLLVTAGYLLWYWLRQLERIGGFLDVWRGVPTCFDGPTRLRGVTVPPTVALVVVALFSVAELTDGPLLAFGLAWPVLLASFPACVRWTRSTQTQMPTNEDRVIVTALWVQYMGIWVVGNADLLVDGELLPIVIAPELHFGLISIAAVAYLPDVIRYERDRGLRRYVTAAYLFGLGAVTGVLALAATGSFATVLDVFAGVCVAGSIAIAAAKRIDA